MNQNNDCVFCNFDEKFILETSDHAFAAFFDCAIMKGHIVIALKDHVTSLSRMTPDQAADIMQLAARVANKAECIFDCEKFYLVSIADEVPHYHIHLLPKMFDAPTIGSHIMGETGWRGEAGGPVSSDDISDFITIYHQTKSCSCHKHQK